jgi:hypothetical protein
MKAIIRWIFSQTKLGQFLDGKKTIIGAALVFTSKVLEALVAIAPILPDQTWIPAFAAQLEQVLKQVSPFLEDVGVGFIGAGLAGKWAKTSQ